MYKVSKETQAHTHCIEKSRTIFLDIAISFSHNGRQMAEVLSINSCTVDFTSAVNASVLLP